MFQPEFISEEDAINGIRIFLKDDMLHWPEGDRDYDVVEEDGYYFEEGKLIVNHDNGHTYEFPEDQVVEVVPYKLFSGQDYVTNNYVRIFESEEHLCNYPKEHKYYIWNSDFTKEGWEKHKAQHKKELLMEK